MEDILISAAAFLFALGVIVFVHELGHHVVAKLFGVEVVTFSLGFGKKLWGFEHGGTDYRVSTIPLGGYVRMGGELPEESTGSPGEFLSKPRWQRILIYIAGPAMNVVLSVGLIAGLFMYGIRMQALQDSPSVIGYVEEDSAAEKAGLLTGDRIVALDGKEISLWKELAFAVGTSPERPLQLAVERDDQRLDVTLVPSKDPRYEFGDAGIYPKLKLRISEVFRNTPAAAAGFHSGDELRSVDGHPVGGSNDFVAYIQSHTDLEVAIEVFRDGELHRVAVTPTDPDGDGKGTIGVGLDIYRQLPFGEAVVESVKYNFEIVQQSMLIIGKLMTRELSAKSSLSGPIEIAAISGRAARRGFKDLLFTMGFLSISIGFMNLLPIPVLDGGHITILLIESLMRRDLSLRLKERITQVGFMMLMTLMAMVIFFDIAKNQPQLMPGS